MLTSLRSVILTTMFFGFMLSGCGPKYICPAYQSAFYLTPCIPMDDSTARLYYTSPLPKNDTIYAGMIELDYKDTSVTVTRTPYYQIEPRDEFISFEKDMPESEPYPIQVMTIPMDKNRLRKPMSTHKREKMLAMVPMQKRFTCCQTEDSLDVKGSSEKVWEIETDNTKIK